MKQGFVRGFPCVEVLTEDDVDAIHQGTMGALEGTGVTVHDDELLRLCAQAGCRVDFEQRRVRIPGSVAEHCLRQAPSSFALRGRNPKNDLRIGGQVLYFSNSMGMSAVAPGVWEPRCPTRAENEDAVKVLDSLETVAYLAPYTPYMEIEGVRPAMVTLEGLATKLRLSGKAIAAEYQNDSELFAVEMAQAVGIDLLGAVSVSPPLTYDGMACKALRRWIRAGFPVCVGSGAMMGGSGPATIAGASVLNNAELVAGVVFAQLVAPGAPVMVADFVHPMDMRRGTPAFGAAECALHGAGFAQIFRGYGLPVSHWYGFGSSKKIDFQSGYERSMIALLTSLSGSNVVELHGAIYGELTWHPVQAVIDDDLAGWIGRFLEGVRVDHETLAVDLIEEVGPIPGFYLDKEHTRRWWKSEQFLPKVADREAYSEWLGHETQPDTMALAQERVGRLLAEYEPKPLPEEQDRAIDAILEEARSYYTRKGLMCERPVRWEA